MVKNWLPALRMLVVVIVIAVVVLTIRALIIDYRTSIMVEQWGIVADTHYEPATTRTTTEYIYSRQKETYELATVTRKIPAEYHVLIRMENSGDVLDFEVSSKQYAQLRIGDEVVVRQRKGNSGLVYDTQIIRP